MSTSLAQIVAALSVTYRDSSVLIWLNSQGANLADDRLDEVADAVRRIGDADPDDFAIVGPTR